MAVSVLLRTLSPNLAFNIERSIRRLTARDRAQKILAVEAEIMEGLGVQAATLGRLILA